MAEEAEMIGKRIRERRDELKLTQRQLADALPGKTESKDISRWENGRHLPHPATLAAVAKALDTTVYDLRAGPLEDRKAPKPGDLDQLNADASELRALDAKLDRVLGQVAELAGTVGEVQANQRVLQEHLQRLDRRTGESGSD